MKFKTFQIIWHEEKPVFTLDFLSQDVVATGGADSTIRVDRSIVRKVGAYMIGVDLEEQLFASGGDLGEVILWSRDLDMAEEPHKTWKPSASLRGHADDVVDLAWSSDGSALASASLAGNAILWDIKRKIPKVHLNDHQHYVQGVAWDPFNQYLVTQGGDRRCKIYKRSAESMEKKETAVRTLNQFRLNRSLFKTQYNSNSSTEDQSGTQKDFLFHDDTLTSFFRRLDWSPDGSFLVVPAGLRRFDLNSNVSSPATHVYARGQWSCPALSLISGADPFVVVRFCPAIFEADSTSDHSEENCIACLPYKLIFACATLYNVLLYSSSDTVPIAMISGLHLAAITDLSWSEDGQYLMVSSRDGYCSIVHFDKGDIGSPLNTSRLHEISPHWLKKLDEIKNRFDAVPSKREVQPQTPSPAKVQIPRSSTKRRITPVAIQSAKPTMAEPKAEDNINDLFKAPKQDDLFSDLRRFSEVPAKKDEEQCNSIKDLMEMSKLYASQRFDDSK